METVQQIVDKKEQYHYYNKLNVQLDIVGSVRKRDIKRILKPSDVKINVQKVNKGLKGFKKSFTAKAKVIIDVQSFIFYLAICIYSAVQFAIQQKPLAYHIVCNIVSVIGLAIKSYTLAHTLCTYYNAMQQRKCQVGPQPDNTTNNETIPPAMELQDVENQVLERRPSQAEPENTRENDKQVLNEKLETDIIKELILDILKEMFIYPAVICNLYGLINEKSWEFDNSLARFHFLIFLYSLWTDALHTKLKYIWAMQKVIISLYCDSDDNWKTKLKKCWLPSLMFTPHVFLFALIHWLILAIIGVRIYVDNFSTEIDLGNRSETSGYQVASYRMNVSNFSTQGNRSETGGYKVTSYTGYMIFCGFCFPIASVIVYIILSRAWFSDEIESTCKRIFHFLVDPVAYIVTMVLMALFIAFCVGIYLPDYDSSEFEVDANARAAVRGLGVAFIIIFLLCNIKATITMIAFWIMIVIIIILGLCKCLGSTTVGQEDDEWSVEHEDDNQN